MASPASIRFFNPGAMYPGPSASNYGSTGYEVIGGGHKIAKFPDAESGAAAHFDLLSRRYSGMPLDQAITKWSGGNSSPAYVQHIAKATALAPNAVLTPELLRDPQKAVALAKAMAQWEAGQAYPLDDAGWSRAHARATGGAPAVPGLPPLSILDPDTGQPKTPAPQPMAAPQPQGQKPMAEEPTFLDSLNGKMSNPLFQQGLGLFLASAQGKDMNQGLNAGMDRAQSAQQQQMRADAEKRRLIQENAIKTLLNNPSAMAGVPEGLKEAVRISGDMGPINQFIMKTQGRDPLEVQQQKLQIEKMQRDLRRPEDDGSKTVELPGGKILRIPRGGTPEVIYETDVQAQRKKDLIGAGIDPASPQGRIFMASGKMPREDQQPLTATDKKAILEADEQINNTQGVIAGLNKAKELSKDAYTGPTAGARGYVMSLFGNKGGEATENMTNVVQTNALQSLKAIFGGNPTEGERKILLELQGSANKSQAVRDDIFDRAKILAERRLEFNKQRANELRGGTFYKPQQPKAAPSSDGWSIQKVE